MAELWTSVGFIRWPLLFSCCVIGFLTMWSTTKLFRPTPIADARTKAWTDAILFWGGFSVITGVLGTLIGFIVAAQSIEAYGSVEATLVWAGFKVAMLSSAWGVLVLFFASLAWFTLQMRWRLVCAEEADDL